MSRWILLGMLGVVLNVGGSSVAASQSSAVPSPSTDSIVPLVDYHTHINSLMWAEAVIPAPHPAVEVPADIAKLLHQIGQAANNKAALLPLYSKSSAMIKSDVRNWTLDKDLAATIWSYTWNDKPYDLLPIAYSVDGNTAFVVAYRARGEGDARTYVGNMLLALQKEEDGVWRVAAQTYSAPGPRKQEAVTPEQLIAELDAAGIKRANILSVAFVLGSANGKTQNESQKVREENDWIAQAAARYPDRLTAFCGFNPLKDYALSEVERCGKNPNVKGIKLKFDDSGVSFKNSEHVRKLRDVFRAANEHRLAITVHMATGENDYDGRFAAEVFLNQLLPVAPDVPIQIAHVTGDSGYGDQTDEALAFFAAAIAAGDSRTRNLYFDISGPIDVNNGLAPDRMELLLKRIRQIGTGRILFGSDRHFPNNAPPADAWKAWRKFVPLTESEFRDIADNVVQYRK